MTYNKYPTSFRTYDEFEEIFESIPAEDRLEWAENPNPKLLRIENEDGWTVAHELARKGTLPKKWITEELLRVEDNELGTTIAHELAYSGTLPEEFITDNLLRIKDWVGRTVAHDLACSGTLPEKFITKKLLLTKDVLNKWTVAHVLAYRGMLPEKFVTEKLLRTKDKQGFTVAKSHYDFLSEHARWDLLTPMLLDAPYNNSNALVITKLGKDLSEMNDAKLEQALSVMSGELRAKLLSDIKDPILFDRIRKCIEREMGKDAFESPSGIKDGTFIDGDEACAPSSGGQDIHAHGQEDLYEYGIWERGR